MGEEGQAAIDGVGRGHQWVQISQEATETWRWGWWKKREKGA